MKHFILFNKIVFTGLILILILTAPVAGARELEKVTFLPMWIPQPQFAGYYMAREKGIYEKYGLDVTILDGGSSRDVATMLKQDEIHFGILNLLTAIIKKSEGMELVNIGQIFQKSAVEFVALTDSGINVPADFNGRKIAVWRTALKSQTYGFLKNQGIKADIYPVNDAINYFLKGAVDICPIMHYNEYNILINHGFNPEELRIFPLGQFNMDFPEDGIYCMENTYKIKTSLVRSFVNASIEGWEYALKHPAETVDVIHKIRINVNIQGNKSHLEWMMNSMQEMIHPHGKDTPIGHLVEADYNHAMEFLLQSGEIMQKIEYGEFHFGNR